MFGISFTELTVILLLCLIIVGPKRMVELAYELGKWFGKIKQQLKHIKETQIDGFDDSVFYDPKVEMNKPLNEIEVTEKEDKKTLDEEKTEKIDKD